jgi:hypothetical protein
VDNARANQDAPNRVDSFHFASSIRASTGTLGRREARRPRVALLEHNRNDVRAEIAQFLSVRWRLGEWRALVNFRDQARAVILVPDLASAGE